MFNKELWTKDLIAWYMYDLANSFITINMTIYFSQWVVVDQKVPDIWFSLGFIIPTLVLVFLSTHVGTLGDQSGKHAKIFIITTVATLFAASATFLAGRFGGGYAVFLALIFYAFYQFFVQLALVPYYALMKHIASENLYGRVSGLGFAASQIGNILGILLTLPLVKGGVVLFGTGRLAPLIPATGAFLIFFVPSYFVFRGRVFTPDTAVHPLPWWKSFVSTLKSSTKYKGVFPLIISFYFFSDALMTLSLYSAIYLQNVFGVVDEVKAFVYVVVLVGFCLGSLVSGFASDRFGHKKVLILSLVVTGLSIIWIGANTSLVLLNSVFFLFGIGMGLVYAASRSYLASLIPASESGTYFGLYTFAERFASVIGPLVWGIVVWSLKGYFPANYRIAVGVLGVLVLFGIVPLLMKKYN